MKKWFLLSLVPALLCGCRSPLEKKFRELDCVVAEKQVWHDRYEHHLDSLKTRLGATRNADERWELTFSILKKYNTYDIDSAQVYARKLSGIAPNTRRREVVSILETARTLIRLNHFDEGFRALSGIDTTGIDKSLLGDIFYMWKEYYSEFAEASPSNRIELKKMSNCFSDSAMAALGPNDLRYIRLYAYSLLAEGLTEDGRNVFKSALDTCSSLRDGAYLTNGIARSYYLENNRDEYLYWLAETAIYDTKDPVRESPTLRRLCIELFEEGDMRRASQYISSVVDDAIASKFYLRANEAVATELSITKAILKQRRYQAVVFSFVVVTIVTLLCLVFLLLLRNRNKSKRLKESLAIIESYLTKHMVMSVENLGKVEQYRRHINKILKEEGVDKMKMELRIPLQSRETYDNFYKEFDEAFLQIYPDFVKNVNALLQTDFHLSLDENGQLSLPLRILATLKLGFTGSGQIASFLNCAPRSVYTYRSKLRKHALYGPENFEKTVVNM